MQKKTYKPAFKDAVIENENIWVFDNTIQALCKISINTWEMDVIKKYKGNEKFVVFWMFSFQDYIFMVTNISTNILKFNKKEQEFYIIENTKEENSQGKFLYAFFEENRIWFVPQCAGRELCYYDLEKEEYVYNNPDFKVQIKKQIDSEIAIEFPCISQNSLWTSIKGKSILMKYELQNNKSEMISYDEFDEFLNAVCFDGERIWISKYNQPDILCVFNNSVRHIVVPGQQSYSFLYCLENYIMALPRWGENIVLVDKKTFQVHILRLYLNESEKESKGSRIINYVENNNYIILIPNSINNIWVIEKKQLLLKRIDIKNEFYESWILEIQLEKELLLYENDNIRLDYYLKCINRRR